MIDFLVLVQLNAKKTNRAFLHVIIFTRVYHALSISNVQLSQK